MSRRPLVVCLACTAALAVVYLVAVLTVPGQALDEWLFGLAQRRLGVGPLQQWWPLLARRVIPFVLIGVVSVLALTEVLRRPRRAVSAVLVVAGSTLLSMILKSRLPRPGYDDEQGFVGNTFPSTHVTATIALVVAVWLLSTNHSRWVARTLAAVAVLVVLGNVVGHAHRPSDALGSVLLVGLVTGAVHLAGGRAEWGYPDGTRERSLVGRGDPRGKDGRA